MRRRIRLSNADATAGPMSIHGDFHHQFRAEVFHVRNLDVPRLECSREFPLSYAESASLNERNTILLHGPLFTMNREYPGWLSLRAHHRIAFHFRPRVPLIEVKIPPVHFDLASLEVCRLGTQ